MLVLSSGQTTKGRREVASLKWAIFELFGDFCGVRRPSPGEPVFQAVSPAAAPDRAAPNRA